MDDNDYVCPLCCEELDISDRQFFPCKCGYQVCMWCWHRIRESESGLCPACRTPYGDDPHEFSAVDVEEVLKANKEKEAAAKRERDRQRQQQNDGNSSDGEGIGALGGGNMKGQMEVPKDRTQLANMRVIRRNLVYAVGLPPSISNEENLRKPEYFGQYGKISKIVLNRSQTTGGDLRRASASAYVTFAHKEDTLACILALDGFYLDGRNIRASYGTSKYCSAFIKNVRCNNPECTYLHQMGDVEDTFTKQEIQAGYVTSGRDVLARQQQIVQQALMAASGAAGGTPRKKSGGGGPSGTGRPSANPSFPPPNYDEPSKPNATLVPPPPGASTRAVTTGSAFPTIAAANSAVPATSVAPSTIARASSVGTNSASATGPAPKAPVGSAAQVARKTAAAGSGGGQGGSGAISAASVVAGFHNVSGGIEAPAPHTTLTPLTPLKRTNASKGASKPVANDSSTEAKGANNSSATTRLVPLRGNGKKQNGAKPSGSAAPGSPASHGTPPGKNQAVQQADCIASIGGAVIAAPVAVAPTVVGGSVGSGHPMESSTGSSLAELGGETLSGLGGEVFNGPLKSSNNKAAIGNGAPVGSNNDKWNATPIGGDPVLVPQTGGLWGNGGSANPSQGLAPGPSMGQVGGSVIGGGFQGSGSSALASMLGINLPTGSGSLRESTDLWGTQDPSSQAPIAALNGHSVPVQGVIGPGASHPSGGLIGGVPIGGGQPQMASGVIGGGGNKSDIALLQSLLPGVHITSGGNYNQGGNVGTIGGSGDWKSAPPSNQPVQHGGNPGMRFGEPQQAQQWNGRLQTGAPPIGAIGQGNAKQGQRQAPGSIW